MSVYVGSSSEERERRDSVANLLVKVQGDLKQLREDIHDHAARGDPVDIQSIQLTLNQIETNITDKTEELVNSQFQTVTTLPVGLPENRQLSRPRPRSKTLPPPYLSHSSPGQEAQLLYISKLLSQPTHPATRQVLSDAFGIPLSGKEIETQRSKKQDIHKRLMPSRTVPQRTALPLINRRSTVATYPVISSKDAQHGILNLLERGLIPKAADIILHPSPVKPKSLPLHKFSKHELKAPPIDNYEGGGIWTGVKFDFSGYSKFPLPGIPGTATVSKQQFKYKPPPNYTVAVHTLPPISPELKPVMQDTTVPLDGDSAAPSGQPKITIRGGSIMEDDDYETVKMEYASKWDMLLRIIKLVEKMAQDYAIPVIFVGTQKAINVAEDYDLEPDPKYKELIPCVLNAREVEHLLSIPGRRYKGHRGIHAAATKIQATYRMYLQRCQYLSYRKMKWASGVIALGWMLYLKVLNSKKYLKEKQETNILNYRKRLQELGETWETFENQKRVIIHVPSKGYPAHIRKTVQNFLLTQAFQLPHIFDAVDPNVELIYVSPIEIQEEVKEYYKQLFNNVKGHKSGSEMWNRIHFIVPECLNSFGHHNLSLASFLKYSPMALKQIRNIIGSHPAVLVPHVPFLDDMAIADQLNIPVIGTEPSLLRLYSSFSGRKALFKAAGVATPPHIKDVYSAEQLVEGLAWLVINHPFIRRWIFKMDHHSQGSGMAYCDIADHLDCHQWILKEKARYGDKWKKQWAQERARRRVLAQLPAILAVNTHPVDTTVYLNWSHFLREFLTSGGSIEGHAPSDSVTSLTTEIYLKPDQSYSLLSTWDHIHSEPFRVWGGSMPQTSVDSSELVSVVERIADAALSRGLMGHISVDYVTFIDPETMSQVTWAVDIDFGPSDMVHMSKLATAIAGLKAPQWSTGQKVESTPQYYMVASTRLKHVNFSLVQYSVFFQMCKAHLIGFNNKTSKGTLFTLVESQRKHNLGMICLQHSLKESLASASHALSVIHQEICTTSDASDVSNFSIVCQAINELVEQM